jgi:hypothetical protein
LTYHLAIKMCFLHCTSFEEIVLHSQIPVHPWHDRGGRGEDRGNRGYVEAVNNGREWYEEDLEVFSGASDLLKVPYVEERSDRDCVAVVSFAFSLLDHPPSEPSHQSERRLGPFGEKGGANH